MVFGMFYPLACACAAELLRASQPKCGRAGVRPCITSDIQRPLPAANEKYGYRSKTYGDVLVLCHRRIDHANSEVFRRALNPLIERCSANGQRLVLDLAGVDYVSSAGLRCFMLAEKAGQVAGWCHRGCGDAGPW